MDLLNNRKKSKWLLLLSSIGVVLVLVKIWHIYILFTGNPAHSYLNEIKQLSKEDIKQMHVTYYTVYDNECISFSTELNLEEFEKLQDQINFITLKRANSLQFRYNRIVKLTILTLKEVKYKIEFKYHTNDVNYLYSIITINGYGTVYSALFDDFLEKNLKPHIIDKENICN